MRKYSLMLLVALLAIALGLGAVACGSGGKTASGQTPQEALTAGLDSLQTSPRSPVHTISPSPSMPIPRRATP